MKRIIAIIAALFACLSYTTSFSTSSVSAIAAPNVTQAVSSKKSSPLIFITNVGQFDKKVLFQVQGENSTLFITENALWFTIIDELPKNNLRRQFQSPSTPDSSFQDASAKSSSSRIRGTNIKLSFPGSNQHPQIKSLSQIPTEMSFFRGKQSNWHADVPVWGTLRYIDLYPGIDLEISGSEGKLEQYLYVKPGANISSVKIQVEGAIPESVTQNTMTLATNSKKITLPLLQVRAGNSTVFSKASPEITGHTISNPFITLPNAVSKETASPAANSLSFSSFIGGQYDDTAQSIAVDKNGAAYITGDTFSPGFPKTAGAFDITCGYSPNANCDFDGQFYWLDAFVVKINPSGRGLSYATFLGGEFNDTGLSIAVDSQGSAYVTGSTISPSFPITNELTGSPYDDTCGTDGICNYDGQFLYSDGFVATLNPTGSSLIYSSYFGGSNDDWGNALAINSNNEIYATGRTYSANFPTTSGAFDTTCGNDSNCDQDINGNPLYDAFIIKFDSECTCPIYSTFIGGGNADTGFGITVDATGASYITGNTVSDDLPVTPNAYDPFCGTDGQCDLINNSVYFDGFAVKVSPDGSNIEYGTYFGGNNGDGGYSIATDSTGAAYITGYTFSGNFPTTLDALDTSYNGLTDSYVLKLRPNGSDLVFSTLLGGEGDDSGNDVAVDNLGNSYVTGRTTSADLPTTVNALNTFFGGASDAFAYKLNSDGSQPIYGTYLGGSGTDSAFALALDRVGNMYIAGATSSSDFPTTQGAYDRQYAGNRCGQKPDDYFCYDAFITKIIPGSIASAPVAYGFIPLGINNAKLGNGVVAPPPPQLCDIYEPNNNRKTQSKQIIIGTSLQAKLCANDEDNFYFDLQRTSNIAIVLDVPDSLKAKTLFFTYSQSDTYDQQLGICENGALSNVNRITATCRLGAGRYVVRIYTDKPDIQFDNTNPYTLRVTTN